MNPFEIKVIIYGVLIVVGLIAVYAIIRQFTKNSGGQDNYWRKKIQISNK